MESNNSNSNTYGERKNDLILSQDQLQIHTATQAQVFPSSKQNQANHHIYEFSTRHTSHSQNNKTTKANSTTSGHSSQVSSSVASAALSLIPPPPPPPFPPRRVKSASPSRRRKESNKSSSDRSSRRNYSDNDSNIPNNDLLLQDVVNPNNDNRKSREKIKTLDRAGSKKSKNKSKKPTSKKTKSEKYLYAVREYQQTIHPSLSNEDGVSGLSGSGGMLSGSSGGFSAGMRHVLPSASLSYSSQSQSSHDTDKATYHDRAGKVKLSFSNASDGGVIINPDRDPHHRNQHQSYDDNNFNNSALAPPSSATNTSYPQNIQQHLSNNATGNRKIKQSQNLDAHLEKLSNVEQNDGNSPYHNHNSQDSSSIDCIPPPPTHNIPKDLTKGQELNNRTLSTISTNSNTQRYSTPLKKHTFEVTKDTKKNFMENEKHSQHPHLRILQRHKYDRYSSRSLHHELSMPDATYAEVYGDAYVNLPIRYIYPTGYHHMRPRSGPWKLSLAIFFFFTWLCVFIVGHCSDQAAQYDMNLQGADFDDDTLIIETRWCGSRVLYSMWVITVLITGMAMAYCSIIGYIKLRDFSVANERSQPPGMVGKSEYYVRIPDEYFGEDNESNNPYDCPPSNSTRSHQYNSNSGPSIYQSDGEPQFWGGHIYRPTQAAVAVTSR